MRPNIPYRLIQADSSTYAAYFATYRKNVWFRPSWSDIHSMMLEATDCYWIYSAEHRIAGISLVDDELGSLFMIPPHTLTKETVEFLKDYMIRKKSKPDQLHAYNVMPEHISLFEHAEFNKLSTRKCMIRPTETLENPLTSKLKRIRPERVHMPKLAEIMIEAYRGGVEEQSMDDCQNDLTYYFDHYEQDELRGASSILVEQDTERIVGFCLVTLWENLPLIYDIAVTPAYRSEGLGSYLLHHAITTLAPIYPVIRLFVTQGNPAEHLYIKVGFLSGDELSHLVWFGTNHRG
ncbi:GNAT family N-acetyltransferase [Paenibacillus sp. MER 99-2]|uniref:GNAT family N-acetyltransferase n=1 Tax=Paenibacillus sp. MER 99-2 TaxID=2939572 RepID=UPI002041B42F|nr:GNAT family N-acetyltransferase [Paenibacillus sp. MER 99-2]MCM3170715.1 GNAT family N-acetyltransferase [Paenibacillus sp. MER 99-2]